VAIIEATTRSPAFPHEMEKVFSPRKTRRQRGGVKLKEEGASASEGRTRRSRHKAKTSEKDIESVPRKTPSAQIHAFAPLDNIYGSANCYSSTHAVAPLSEEISPSARLSNAGVQRIGSLKPGEGALGLSAYGRQGVQETRSIPLTETAHINVEESDKSVAVPKAPYRDGNDEGNRGREVVLRPVDADSASMIEQAISLLREHWPAGIIPSVFAYRTRICTHPATSNPCLNSTGRHFDIIGCLVPIEKFAKDILARSRATGAILKLAIQHIEFLQPYVIKAASGIRTDPAFASAVAHPSNNRSTVCARTNDTGTFTQQDSNWLPSPLLCPRRVFLVTLILASKFVEDAVLSNREWARIAGLPAHEVFRCEIIVGEALQLWRSGRIDAGL